MHVYIYEEKLTQAHGTDKKVLYKDEGTNKAETPADSQTRILLSLLCCFLPVYRFFLLSLSLSLFFPSFQGGLPIYSGAHLSMYLPRRAMRALNGLPP